MYSHYFKKTLCGFLLLLVMSMMTGCSFQGLREGPYKSDVPVTHPIALDEEMVSPKEGEIAPELNLDVLFYSQAPFGNWGMPYQEACEEASLLLAHYYTKNQTVSIEQFERDLLAMVEWEINYFGQYEHTSIEETAEMAREYLGYDAVEIVENPTVDTLKQLLAQGYPVIAPFAGRSLGNPYYTGEGPVYHMLVIRGYDETHFITNDVGTRHGENFIYSYDVLLNALHDWHPAAENDPSGILEGEKKVLILQ